MIHSGLTKDNCVILIIRPRFYLAGDQDIDTFVRYGMFVIEQAISRIETQGLNPRINAIYDQEGMGSANRDSTLIKFLIKIITMMQDYYPERLGNFFALRPNFWFRMAKNCVWPFLAVKTREKLKIIENNEEMEEWIDKEQLPRCYGGQISMDYDPY